MTDGTRPLIVEFTGLPGAGKTTLAKALAHELRRRGHPVVSTHELWAERGRRRHARSRLVGGALRVAGAASFGARHPRLVLSAHAYATAIRPLRVERLRRAATLVRMARTVETLEKEATRRASRVAVLDQGPLQELWSACVAGTAPPRARIAAVRRHLGPLAADLVVIVHAPVDVAVHRLAARKDGRSRFDRMPRQEAAVLLRRHVDHFERIGRVLADGWRDDLVAVDARRPPEENAARIAAAIEARLEPAPGGADAG